MIGEIVVPSSRRDSRNAEAENPSGNLSASAFLAVVAIPEMLRR